MTTKLTCEKTKASGSSTFSTIVSKNVPSKASHCCFCTLKLKDNSPRLGCPIHRAYSCVTNGKHSESFNLNSYDTVGVFCSYPCAKAFARANIADPIFARSEILLAGMFAQEHGISGPITINPSPSPLLLTKFGGNMSAEQYEIEKGKVVYIPEGKIANQHPVTTIYTRIE